MGEKHTEFIKIPSSVTLNKESTTAVDLHVFGDGSTVVYAVVHQSSVTNHRLVVSKSRISNKNNTIPRLELVSTHFASHLIENKKTALKSCHIRLSTGWTDTVIVQWRNRRPGLYNSICEK